MTQLVDIYGNPLKQTVLREPQTAKLIALQKEYAEHPVKGLTPAKLARILLEAEQGNLQSQAELFQDMQERDAHLYAEFSKRKRAILGFSWAVEPPPNATPQEQGDADFLNEILADQDGLEELFLNLLEGIGYGYSANEIQWTLAGGRTWLPERFNYIPPSWFQVPRDRQNELRLRKDGEVDGEKLLPFGWIVHSPRALSGYLARSGLFRVLAWPFLFKNYAIRDLAEMLEIYGLPLRIGKYPPGTTDAEKATLLRAVTGLGHSAAGIIPQSMLIEFEQAAQGTSDPFLAMQSWADAAISKAIIGGTLTAQTSDTGGGSYSLGEVHNEVRHDIATSDANQLADTLNKFLLWPLLVLNRPGNNDVRRRPKLVFDTKAPEDISKLADAVPKLVEVGLQIPASWLYDKTGIPEPIEGDVVLQKQQTAPTAMLTGRLPNNLAALTFTPVAQGQNGLDKANDELDPKLINTEMAKLLQPVVDKLQALGGNATGEDFYEALVASYPEMNDSELRELLARAIFSSKIWGLLNGNG